MNRLPPCHPRESGDPAATRRAVGRGGDTTCAAPGSPLSFEGDTHVATEFRGLVRQRLKPNGAPPVAARAVGELRARADAIAGERERARAESAAAERKRREEETERSRRARLDGVARRGESVWREIEAEIERRSPVSYDKAAGLLFDLQAIAEEKGETEDFARRLRTIRERHARKERFLERLTKLGEGGA